MVDKAKTRCCPRCGKSLDIVDTGSAYFYLCNGDECVYHRIILKLGKES